MSADQGGEQAVELGNRYRNGDLLLEIVGAPYTNETTGMDYAEVRIVESAGFTDVSEREARAKYPLVVLRTQFERISAAPPVNAPAASPG